MVIVTNVYCDCFLLLRTSSLVLRAGLRALVSPPYIYEKIVTKRRVEVAAYLPFVDGLNETIGAVASV